MKERWWFKPLFTAYMWWPAVGLAGALVVYFLVPPVVITCLWIFLLGCFVWTIQWVWKQSTANTREDLE